MREFTDGWVEVRLVKRKYLYKRYACFATVLPLIANPQTGANQGASQLQR